MIRLGIVCALPGELRCLGAGGELAPDIRALVAGIGPQRAEQAARQLVESGAQALASFGVAGGLDPRLRPGALVVPDEVIDVHGARQRCDPDWRARVRAALESRVELCEGTLAESDSILARREQKAALGRETGAVAVDMESGAVAREAGRAGLPFIALRAICDAAGREVPRASLVAVDGRGKVQLGALLAALVRRPTDLGGLFAMHDGWRRAARTLSAVVRELGPELLAPDSR